MNEAVAVRTETNQRILVVDDEQSICRILSQILEDEGYEVKVVNDGESALAILESFQPSVVFLDIWMPGVDGIEVLKRIRSSFVNPPPVVMISGHATIATAVEATKIGAFTFIEKPLDLDQVLQVVNSCLDKTGIAGEDLIESQSQKNSLLLGDIAPAISAGLPKFVRYLLPPEQNYNEPSTVDLSLGPDLKINNRETVDSSVGNSFAVTPPKVETYKLCNVVFNESPQQGTRYQQKTIRSSVILYGQGLHSGRKSGLIIEPLPPNSGIHFAAVGEATTLPAHLNFVKSTGFATTLRHGNIKIATIEHLLSALNAYGITNLLIKCENEVPVMDGSSLPFCELLDDAGVVEQDEFYNAIKIKHKIRIGTRTEWIQIEPAEGFSIDYTLNYPKPVGVQRFSFTLEGIDSYKSLISPARTFGFIGDIGHLQRQGLALGGRFDNFVLIGENGPLNGELRFKDEFVRHKILDAIGDLFLLGRRIDGKVKARMTGHSDNIELLKEIRKTFSS
jgi:UDP-3-O-acyl N-acetylglucosamine deacetylase